MVTDSLAIKKKGLMFTKKKGMTHQTIKREEEIIYQKQEKIEKLFIEFDKPST